MRLTWSIPHSTCFCDISYIFFVFKIYIYPFSDKIGFDLDNNGIFVWPLFAVYGFYIALTDGVSKAFVGKLVSKEVAGTAYGILTTVTSIFTLLASVIGGLLWTFVNPSATFYFAAICAVLSLFVFLKVKSS